MLFLFPIFVFTSLFCISFAEVPFFLGEKGVATCPGGYSVTDSATCELACNQLEMPIKGELSDGKLCYQNNGRKRKGCKQNGRNSHKARLVCENHGYTLMPECYGGDIEEQIGLTMKECISGCKSQRDCMFITYGKGRCIYKNAKKSVHDCVGCDSNGFCSNEGPCDIETQFCGVNMYSVTPECYGGDIYEEAVVGTLEDCIFGCKSHENCKFITYGKGRCIFKDGLTSVHECVGCNTKGYCSNEGSCDVETKFCAVNI